MAPLSVLFFGLFLVLGKAKTLESTATDGKPAPDPIMSNNTNPLTSHALDQATGRPAASVKVVLHKLEGGTWSQVSEKLTNREGRVGHMIPGPKFTPGVYKLNFDTLSYYKERGEKTFYPYIEIVFEIERPEEHYHVPLLLNAYGYSTYRGS